MARFYFKEKTLEEKFQDAIYYIETHDFPEVTFHGLHISTLNGCRDESIMIQIIEIVDAIKLFEKESKGNRSRFRIKPAFKRNTTATFNKSRI